MANYQSKTRPRSEYIRKEEEVVRDLKGIVVQVANGRVDPKDDKSDHNVVETLKFTGNTTQKQALLALKGATLATDEEAKAGKIRYICGVYHKPKFKPQTKEVINVKTSKVGGFYCFTPETDDQALCLAAYAQAKCKVEPKCHNMTFASRRQAIYFAMQGVTQGVDGMASLPDAIEMMNFVYLADREGWKRSNPLADAGM
jgi:hypothetical protein